MKLIVEYLDLAVRFTQLAAEERNPDVRAAMEQQAAAYRRLAEVRARQLGLPLPDEPSARGS